MLRLVVLISGNGSNLQAIIDYLKANPSVPAKIVAVMSNRPEAFGITRAKMAGIIAKSVDHKKFATREAFDAQLQKEIDQFAPDALIFAGFMRILTPQFIQHYAGRMLNIHPSLLPKFQGLDTHARAIAAHEKEHGCSVHLVTEDLDGGPIILQGVVPIEASDTTDTLKEKVHEVEHRIYPQVIHWLAEKRLSITNNQPLLDGQPLPPQGLRIDT